ncbi:MAG: anaerobic sulfite reductase subunit AsrA [Fibrobacteres bacterium]|nr:anaerobic sulfite reductase subunit AsrA [Fibrobacterota bacterium]
MAIKLKNEEFDAIIKRLRGDSLFYAPVKLSGKGRFSDTDLVKYREITSIGEIVFDKKSFLSLKEIILPATQKLFEISEGKLKDLSKTDSKRIIIFARSCDIHAVHRLDEIFLKNGNTIDPYYQAIRNRIKFIFLECPTQFESCFCVSMGTNKPVGYAAALRVEKDHITLDFVDESFKTELGITDNCAGFAPIYPVSDINPVSPPLNSKMPETMFSHQLFDAYDTRCIACGRCNTSCPTCSCFSTMDVTEPDKKDSGERRRIWDGCHLDGFTEMAGGHSFRKKHGSRMRFKTFHKIYDFRMRFGKDMCVGCGRCDDVCPELISFADCINSVTKALEKEERI